MNLTRKNRLYVASYSNFIAFGFNGTDPPRFKSNEFSGGGDFNED
jgi:hypothetical protein